MSIKEQVIQQLDSLDEAELEQLAEYLAFLRFRSRIRPIPEIDEKQLADLYAEFADEDRNLAEEGLSDYFKGLMRIEDHIFLHSPEIQEQIRESEEDIKAGRYMKFKATEIDKLLEWLDAEEK